VSSSYEIMWSGSAAGSASFNSQAAAVGIRGTAGAVGIPGAEGIIDRIRRERRAVAPVGVNGRIRIIRVRAQVDSIVPLLVIQPRRICGERIRRGLIAEGTAVGTEGIVQAVRLEGTSSPEGIGRGSRIEWIRAQLSEILRETERSSGSSRSRRRKTTFRGHLTTTPSGVPRDPHAGIGHTVIEPFQR
jgi:hypothetical protein